MNYEVVEKYLKTYSIEEPPYDSNGAIHLLKAIVENLQEHFVDSDFEDYSSCLDKKNEEFLTRLVLAIPESRKSFSEEWEHRISTQTQL